MAKVLSIVPINYLLTMLVPLWYNSGVTERNDMPVVEIFKEHPEVKGVFVGGCINRGEGSSFRASAHAHTDPDYPNHGWICVRSHRKVYNSKGEPSNLMKHELAHILTGLGHTQKWADKLRELGGRIPKGRYRYVR